MELKTCTRCKIEQSIENYYIRRTRNNERKAMCKECESKSKAKHVPIIPDLEGESWKDVQDYEGLYLVSNMARVRSIFARKNPCNILMTSCPNETGYHMVNLSKNGKAKTRYLSRLVAIAFIPNPENKPEVNHIGLDENGKPGNKNDNRSQSLEWSTSKENINHSWENGLSKPQKGSAHGNSTLTEKNVLEIRASKLTPKQIACLYDVNVQAIYKILSRKRWRHI